MSSMVNSTTSEEDKYPAAFKLLIWCMVATLFTGAMGTITGYVDTFVGLASATGAEKAVIMHLSMEQSRMSFYFALGSILIQLTFLGIAWMIIYSKRGESFIPALSPDIKRIQIPLYGVIITSIPVLTGIFYCWWYLEKMVVLKPGESIPIVWGIMEFPTMMNICFISGCAGVILLFVLLVKTVITHKTPD